MEQHPDKGENKPYQSALLSNQKGEILKIIRDSALLSLARFGTPKQLMNRLTSTPIATARSASHLKHNVSLGTVEGILEFLPDDHYGSLNRPILEVVRNELRNTSDNQWRELCSRFPS